MPRNGFDIIVVGGINSDFVLRGERVPKPGETVVMPEFFQGPGGKGANQAVAAARLGARVMMIGCVGNDERGEAVIRNLRDEGVETRFIARAKISTGAALILVDQNGEKSIGACMGANLKLSAAHVKAAANAFEKCKVVLMQFEAPDGALLAAAKLAKRVGAKVILDPAPPRRLPKGLIELLDVIRPNASEAEFLTGIKVKDQASARRAAEVLITRGASAVALQAGSAGDLFVWPGGEEYLPHFKVKAVDATGAGDAFAAGLAVGLAERRSMAEAGKMGSGTAALKMLKMGAQAGLPSRRALENFLRERG